MAAITAALSKLLALFSSARLLPQRRAEVCAGRVVVALAAVVGVGCVAVVVVVRAVAGTVTRGVLAARLGGLALVERVRVTVGEAAAVRVAVWARVVELLAMRLVVVRLRVTAAGRVAVAVTAVRGRVTTGGALR